MQIGSHIRLSVTKTIQIKMNISPETPSNGSSRSLRSTAATDELTQLKKELLQAEVRHARARAAVSGAEADVKVLNARLRALTK